MRTKKDKLDPTWPAWFYGPDGLSGIFKAEEDVPKGWARVKGKAEPVPPDNSVIIDHDDVRQQLEARGVVIKGWWSGAYMKELLES